MFIAREKELDELKTTFKEKGKKTILLYGRRRIGKTSLIKKAIEGEEAFVIYHEFHRVTLTQNLIEFSTSIKESLSMPFLPSFTNLVDVFSFLNGIGKKCIVVMDEYSDMKEFAPKGSVDSYMRTVIDNLSDDITLIITGSLLKVMEELLEEENPLFARFTKIIKLEPLDYYDAAKFFPNLNPKNFLEFYSVFGGSPYVLSLINEEKDLKWNICELIIKQSGSVRSYAENVINMEAGRTAHGITILSILCNGKRKYGELENIIGKEAKGVLNKELKELIALDIISRIKPINSTEKAKIFYEITDPLIRFYLKYINQNPSLLMTNEEVFYNNFISKSIKDFIARRFEDVSRQYFLRLIKNGIRQDILDIGTYWYDDKETKSNGEFDVALKTMDGYEIYDAKFVLKPISREIAETEGKQIKRLTLNISRWGIISTEGFENSDSSYIQLDTNDLFFNK